MITLNVSVQGPDELLDADVYGAGALLRVEWAATETGTFVEFSTQALAAGTHSYAVHHAAGVAGYWYRTRYSKAVPVVPADYSAYSDPFPAPNSWPSVAELKQVLDITSTDWDDTVDRVLASAISKVKQDVGGWVEGVDEPDDNLIQAALRMGELLSLKPELAAGTVTDPTYQRLLYGHRRTFGIS